MQMFYKNACASVVKFRLFWKSFNSLTMKYSICSLNQMKSSVPCQKTIKLSSKSFVTTRHLSEISNSQCDQTNDLMYVADLLSKCLDKAMKEQRMHVGLLVPSLVIQEFCMKYNGSSPDMRQSILLLMCNQYGVDHAKVVASCNALLKNAKQENTDATHLQSEDRLRAQLHPVYYHLFQLIGRLTDGVKFLTDMRNDALVFASKASNCDALKLRDLSNHLKTVLSFWFSVGLLELTRITWETPADILEKIAKNEAVHSVRSWTDLKKRLGPARRCYAFFHSSMPRDPLLLLHVALTGEITRNITDIVDYSARSDSAESGDVREKTTAMFYSITSTQRGLQGIEFGIHMIRSVVEELRLALPNLRDFSSLSPIPRYKDWLMGRLMTDDDLFLPSEIADLKSYFRTATGQATREQVRTTLAHNSWARDEHLAALLRKPLLRLCAHYLYRVKSRGYSFDPVANFHLRNGAILWRINWMADPSVKGLDQSFGLMVNYRYYLDKMEANSRQYILQQDMVASRDVLLLLSDAASKSAL